MESKNVNVAMDTLISKTASKSIAAESNDISKKIEELITMSPPEGTEAYTAVQLMCVPTALKSKIDFTNGGKRNPRWGMVFSFSIVPQLDTNPIGPMMLPSAQAQFITADSIEEIRARLMFEIDKSIQLAKIADSDPSGYEQYEKALLKYATAGMSDEGGC